MNYLDQIKGFYMKRQLSPLSSGAITLYYLLLEQFNMADFPKAMEIPMKKLATRTGLRKNVLRKARRELVKNGYLTLSKSNTGEHRVYCINSLNLPAHAQTARG